ncbi:CFH [Bugula neritina]|uniref:CFH n=1 Tax=Bugula neritina TaxID=10212 RepID=A0A7J7K166_BUGNE|nr:CFH [Bugula neritina]
MKLFHSLLLLGAFLAWEAQCQTTNSSVLNCTSPPYVSNANHSETGTSPGSIATYTCYPGFRTTGSVQKTCRDGQWVSSGPSLYCQEIYCSYPPTISGGSYRGSASYRTPLGTIISYYCYSGYVFNGTHTDLTCQDDGNWTPLNAPVTE